MIAVSEKYKEAVKNSVREIDSFIELLVDGMYIRGSEYYGRISSNDKAEITVLDTTIDDNSAFCNYASLEQDYFLLDGSFILPNRSGNKNTGFIGDINSSTLTISNIGYETPETERNKKCITVYFENGYATDFTIMLEVDYGEAYLRTLTYNFTNNNKKIITTEPITDLVGFKNIKNIVIIVDNWSNSNHRVRIRQVNLGETVLYESNEIININIKEETDIYNIDIPNNDCSVELNNYDRKFNVVDENNILNRLNANSIIRLYFGLKVDGNYEYQCMGNYQFNSYDDNNNYYTTLNGIGIIEDFDKETSFLVGINQQEDTNFMLNQILNLTSIYEADVQYNEIIPTLYTNFDNKREQLQALMILSESYLKQTRENTYYDTKNRVRALRFSNEIVDTIDLDIQLQQPKFIKKNKISGFTMNYKSLGTLNNDEEILFEETVIPYYNIDNRDYRYYVRINSESPIKLDTVKGYVNNSLSSNVSLETGKSYYQMTVFVKNLSNDNPITFKITAKRYENQEQTFDYGNMSEEIIEFNNNYLRTDIDKNRVANYLMNLEKPYTFEFEMMADPSLEVGDVILFENIDGYKKGIITSLEFKFNGALTCNVKGECENVL